MLKLPGKLRGAALTAICAALAACASLQGSKSASAGIAPVDTSIRPGDDFYGYANSIWAKTTHLADGQSKIDTSSILREENARRVQGLIEEAAHETPGQTDVQAKIADYYKSRLDLAGIEAKGLAPLSADLAAIAAISDRSALAGYLGRTLRLDDGGDVQPESLWAVWVHQGFHDPTRYAAHLVQGGLGLADADDYLDDAAGHVSRRNLYRAHVENVLALAGFAQPATRAAHVLKLETAIAKTHASRADTDHVAKTDNAWLRADFAAKSPSFDWNGFFSASGLDRAPGFVVWQPRAVIESSRLAVSQPLDVWKDYLAFHLIDHYAPVLPQALADERRDFAARLAGMAQSQAPDLTTEAIAETETSFGDGIGRLYVERYFPPQAKAAARDMVENIRTAFRAHLAALTWMSPQTKSKALAKLDALRFGLGYPESWTDYADLPVVKGDAFGNLQRSEAFQRRRELAKLSGPADLDEWPAQLHPQTVGAVLNLSPNTMDFAAGILQPPYFDPSGDAAANYGSAGAGLAHEVTHSFDELGSRYDASGRLGNWWTASDAQAYRTVAAPLAAQLDRCCPLPGICARGEQVLAESAADLAGLAVAHDAYLLSLDGKPDTVKSGLTGDQRFFVAFAQRWRRLQTEASLKGQIAGDSHAPPLCRSDLVRNLDEWERAFDIKSGDAMFLKGVKRVRVW